MQSPSACPPGILCPLTLLVMEISETLRSRDCELYLEWIRRDKNQLADDLTNEEFKHFDFEQRVRWNGGCCEWMVLHRFLKHARDYHSELVSEKTSKAPRVTTARKRKAKLEQW